MEEKNQAVIGRFGIGKPPADLVEPKRGRYVGQVIIKVYEPDAHSDGLEYSVELVGPPNGAAFDRFARETIEKLRARLQRQAPLR